MTNITSTIIRQTRLTIFVYIILVAVWFLPDDADATRVWLTNMPLEK